MSNERRGSERLAVLVHAKGLRKEYGSGEGLVRALDAVDLDVNRGEAVAVMGPSGCGKSTLLHLIGGLDRPSAGELSVAGQRVDQLSERALAHLRRDEIGFVFQAFHLMDELTAQENVELPALLAGCIRRARLVHAPRHSRRGRPRRSRPAPSLDAVRRSTPTRRDRASTRERTGDRAGGRADRQLGQRRGVRPASGCWSDLHAKGLTLVIVTHDERIAATADRIDLHARRSLCRRDTADGGSRGDLGTFSDWERLS
jgi:putative ABC transport system ATP-binding protein